MAFGFRLDGDLGTGTQAGFDVTGELRFLRARDLSPPSARSAHADEMRTGPVGRDLRGGGLLEQDLRDVEPVGGGVEMSLAPVGEVHEELAVGIAPTSTVETLIPFAAIRRIRLSKSPLSTPPSVSTSTCL